MSPSLLGPRPLTAEANRIGLDEAPDVSARPSSWSIAATSMLPPMTTALSTSNDTIGYAVAARMASRPMSSTSFSRT